MQLISAKEELEKQYNIKLKPKQKFLVLGEYIKEFDNKYLNVTNARERVVRLAIKQVLDECLEILKTYCAIDEALLKEEE